MIMHPDVVYPWYPVQRGVRIHESQRTDHRTLALTFAKPDGTLVPLPAEVVRVLDALPDTGELHERINVAARIAADNR